jgi:hypothetical protein
MHSTDRIIHKLDLKDGHILEVITLSKDDLDPHGMCMYKGISTTATPASHWPGRTRQSIRRYLPS